MTPSNENEAKQMLYTGYLYDGPASVRYPRGSGPGQPTEETMEELPIGKSRVLKRGTKVAILAFGSMVQAAKMASEKLNPSLVDMRFVKPLDIEIILEVATQHHLLVTIEENALAGGAGSAVNEVIYNHQIRVEVLNLGVPDSFMRQDKPANMLQRCQLDEEGILNSIERRLTRLTAEAASNN